MSQAIVNRTISAQSDNRLSLTNGQAMRNLSFLTTWNVVRLGIQFGWNGAASLSGTPQLVMGLNAGILDGSGNPVGYADPATSNFFGMRTLVPTMTYNAGPPAYYSNATVAPKPCTRVGSTLTDGTAFGSTGPWGSAALTTARSALIIQVTKGSPNFTIEAVFATNATGAQADINDTKFLDMMESLTMADAASIQSGYNAMAGVSMAVNEAANGYLNTMLIYWNRTSVPLEVSAVRHRRIS